MKYMNDDVLMFFNQQPGALPLYEAFAAGLPEHFPAAELRVQKTQITFSNRNVFACVSFQRVKKKAELPEPYIVVTLGFISQHNRTVPLCFLDLFTPCAPLLRSPFSS